MAQGSTRRGRRTRERIVEAAAHLMHLRGVNATTVEDVLEAAGAGKGQFYHYFESRAELEAAVLDFQVARQPEAGSDPPTSWGQVDAWFDAIYALYAMNDFQGGCPLGSMASEVVDRDAGLRRRLDEAFQAKADYLARGLEALRARGELERTADPEALAEFAVAVAQGGLLLARTRRSGAPLRNALDHAREHLRTYRAEGAGDETADS